MERVPRLVRRRLLLETPEDVAGGSHSLPELEWLRLLRRAGLSLPSRQVKVRRPDGTYYLHAEWTDLGVGAEINGAQHDDLLAREYDHQRHSALVASRRQTMYFSSHAVRHQGQAVTETVMRVLRAYGWP